jgi:hypothetical protein
MNRRAVASALDVPLGSGSGCRLLKATSGTNNSTAYYGKNSMTFGQTLMVKRETKLDLYNRIRCIGARKLDL